MGGGRVKEVYLTGMRGAEEREWEERGQRRARQRFKMRIGRNDQSYTEARKAQGDALSVSPCCLSFRRKVVVVSACIGKERPKIRERLAIVE